MKFSVGYQFTENGELTEAVLRHKSNIYEVYFSFGDYPNGRHAQDVSDTLLPHEAQGRQLEELRVFAEAGIPLNILFNGNCYGKHAESRSFFTGIGNTVDYFATHFGLASVTTTSPLIAKFIKQNFPTLQTRASVNMEIGTTQGMDYQGEYFDGFYMKRELNRDMAAIRRLRAFCDRRKKSLYMLANSGCLNFCSSHIFHDNLVAHEREIAEMDNAYLYLGTCKEYLAEPRHRISLVRDTNWVRPEDMGLYEGLFTAAKLATRVNPHPARIIEAYMSGRYHGSTLELLEPDHSALLYPYYLDNRRLPDGFAEQVATCSKDCDNCHYCQAAYDGAVIHLEDTVC